MIDNISLKDFKCFSNISLDLNGLTLLTGFNAAGKSSAIQALLSLSQTCKEKISRPELLVNGLLINLGSPGEIINDQSETGVASVDIKVGEESLQLELSARSENERQLVIDRVKCTNKLNVSGEYTGDEILRKLQRLSSPFDDDSGLGCSIRDMVFISAVRDGALDIYPSPDKSYFSRADVGANGRYSAWWFAEYMDEEIPQERCHSSDSAKTLRRQFNAWASSIFPGVEANATRVLDTDFVRLQFRAGPTDKWRRPGNIGYGLTYVFPIIVACLLAKKGQVIIIDSPEAHLHPLGQSRMGMFLAKVAESGVQIIIETHSDHVLNGTRIAAKESIISPSKMIVHFFKGGRQERNSPPPIITSVVSNDGGLSDWPDGFFDQAEKDLAQLAGWTHGKADN